MSTTIARANRADPSNPLPDERGVSEEAAETFADPTNWLNTQHPMLGGRSPSECIRDGDEQLVRDLLRRIKLVGQT